MALKKKIAILGGGIGGLSSAYHLTEHDPLREKYEITVYQMGWRLGGKCASSRNPNENNRIEEHGIHLFGGFYYNTFAVMKKAYDELKRPADEPLSSIQKAFIPSNFATMWETFGQQMYEWDIGSKPVGDSAPWEVSLHKDCSAGSLLSGALTNILKQIVDSVDDLELKVDSLFHSKFLDKLLKKSGLRSNFHRKLIDLQDDLLSEFEKLDLHDGCLRQALEKLQKFRDSLDPEIHHHPTKLRHLFFKLDFMVVLFLGFIKDDVANKGFDILDDIDWIEWLKKHGLSAATLASPLPITSPNILFGFRDGNTSNMPEFAAGAMLHWTLLMLNYTHSQFYFFTAGTGETIIQPLYEMLKLRGVKFEFFHKVTEITQKNGNQIDAVEFDIQCTLNNPDQEYQPLNTIVSKGLTGWPDFPLVDQLVEGEKLKTLDSHGLHYNLESYWTSWGKVGTKKLRQGIDFDSLICALSIGALPSVAGDLINNNSSWRDMVQHVQAIQTQSFQIWLTKPKSEVLSEVAAHNDDVFVSGNYINPTSDVAELGHLIKFEDWDGHHKPAQSVMYFCGPMVEDEVVPAFTDHDYPRRQYQRVKNQSIQLLQAAANPIMPGATLPNNGRIAGDTQGLAFDVLAVSDEDAVTTSFSRVHQQFFRANIDPTERYVLSLPKSTKYRLKPSESGYSHLYLAGDWTDTGYNFGAVETTVISGKLAAAAVDGSVARLAGHPLSGVGRTDFIIET
jgi:uncharacterized protein with NAD-binding domain and iron-sulfur cluster